MPEYLFPLYNLVIWNICFFIAFNGYQRSYPHSRVFFTKRDYQLAYLYIILFIFYSLFTFYGGDDKRYREFVEWKYIEEGEEYIYVLIAEFVTPSLVLWKMFVYIPAIMLTFKSFKRFNSDSFVTYLSLSLLAFVSYGAARIVLAMSVLVYAISFFETNSLFKRIIGIVIGISSIFFHYSMAVPVLFFIVSAFVKLNRKKMILALLLIPIIAGSVYLFLEELLQNDIFLGSYIEHKASRYTDEETHDSEFTYGSMFSLCNMIAEILVTLILLFYSIKCSLKDYLSKGKEMLVSISFMMLLFSIVMIASQMPGCYFLAIRFFGMVPFLLLIVVYPLIYYNILPRTGRMWLFCFLFVKINLNFIYFMYDYALNGM